MIQNFYQQLNDSEMENLRIAEHTDLENRDSFAGSQERPDFDRSTTVSVLEDARSEVGNDYEMIGNRRLSIEIPRPKHQLNVHQASQVCYQLTEIFNNILRQISAIADETNCLQSLEAYLREIEYKFQGPCYLGRVKQVFEKKPVETLRNTTIPCIVRFFAWCDIRLHDSIFPKQMLTPMKCCQFLKDEIKIFKHSPPLIKELISSLELLQSIQSSVFEDVDIINQDWHSCFKLEKISSENILNLLKTPALSALATKTETHQPINTCCPYFHKRLSSDCTPDSSIPYSSSQLGQATNVSVALVESMQRKIQELIDENISLKKQAYHLHQLLGTASEVPGQQIQNIPNAQHFLTENIGLYNKAPLKELIVGPHIDTNYRPVTQDLVSIHETVQHNTVSGIADIAVDPHENSEENMNNTTVNSQPYYLSDSKQSGWHPHKPDVINRVSQLGHEGNFTDGKKKLSSKWQAAEIERSSLLESPDEINELESETMDLELRISSRGKRFPNPMNPDGKKYMVYPDGTLQIVMAHEMESIYSIYNEYIQSLQPQILSYAKDYGRARLANFKKKRTFQKRKAFVHLVHKVSTALDADIEEILDLIDSIRLDENRSVVWVCNNMRKLKEEMVRKRPELNKILLENSS